MAVVAEAGTAAAAGNDFISSLVWPGEAKAFAGPFFHVKFFPASIRGANRGSARPDGAAAGPRSRPRCRRRLPPRNPQPPEASVLPTTRMRGGTDPGQASSREPPFRRQGLENIRGFRHVSKAATPLNDDLKKQQL